MTKPQNIVRFRRDIFDRMNVSYDYYPAHDATDKHCRWVCTDIACNAPAFKSYPEFVKHLAKVHKISFSVVTWMRFYNG